MYDYTYTAYIYTMYTLVLMRHIHPYTEYLPIFIHGGRAQVGYYFYSTPKIIK